MASMDRCDYGYVKIVLDLSSSKGRFFQSFVIFNYSSMDFR